MPLFKDHPYYIGPRVFISIGIGAWQNVDIDLVNITEKSRNRVKIEIGNIG